MAEKPLIVIGGALANKPFNGGEAWVRLSWIRGFQRLGFPVLFVEQLRGDRQANAPAIAYFRAVTGEFGLGNAAALIDGDGTVIAGALDAADLATHCAQAALLVNISGHLPIREPFDRIGVRALVDVDPGYTQFWHAQGLAASDLDGHHALFTVGRRVGRPDCPIPTCGRRWIGVWPPVVLEDWPIETAPPSRGFTTVGSWRGAFGPVKNGEVVYGVKAHEFRKLLPLPMRARQPIELALDIHAGDAKDRAALESNGWRMVDPRQAAGDPRAFAEFVRASRGEISPAQGIYVATRCGWFSDRTTRYLASGRPAIVQATGFEDELPTGRGLLKFADVDEAAAAVAAVDADYASHCRAARATAAEFFDSDRVLKGFLAEVGIAV